jgi:hypothetical protein
LLVVDETDELKDGTTTVQDARQYLGSIDRHGCRA